jgi:CRP/FNR family transcriptional regulator, cyclic AMP receptor protein
VAVISLETLQRIAIWARDLRPEELERARKGISEKTYGKGAYICHRGDRFDAWAGVISGLVKLSAVSQAGKAVTFAGLPNGAWFGEGSILKTEERRYDLVALRETRLALMDIPTFFWLFENSVGFNRYLVRQFNERLGQFIGQVENDRMLDATGRVARALACLFNPDLHPTLGSHISITQEEVGLLSGLSRQVANQSLKALEQAGHVRVERGGITALSIPGLRGYGD